MLSLDTSHTAGKVNPAAGSSDKSEHASSYSSHPPSWSQDDDKDSDVCPLTSEHNPTERCVHRHTNATRVSVVGELVSHCSSLWWRFPVGPIEVCYGVRAWWCLSLFPTMTSRPESRMATSTSRTCFVHVTAHASECLAWILWSAVEVSHHPLRSGVFG